MVDSYIHFVGAMWLGMVVKLINVSLSIFTSPNKKNTAEYDTIPRRDTYDMLGDNKVIQGWDTR